MREMQTEVLDSLKTRQLELNITTGSVFTATSSTVIRAVFLAMPKKGPNANDTGNWAQFSLDGGLKWTTVDRGSAISIDGEPYADSLIVRAGSSNAKVEVILLEEY